MADEKSRLYSTSTILEFRRSLWHKKNTHTPKAPRWIKQRTAAVLPDYCDYQSIAADDDDDNESYGICGATCLFWKLCCFISFLPCANTRRVKGSIIFGVFILIPSLVFMVMTGMGPLRKPSLTTTSAITMSLSAPILLLMSLGCCFSTFKLYETGWRNSVLYSVFCCNCVSLVILIVLTVVGSLLLFQQNTFSILFDCTSTTTQLHTSNASSCAQFNYAPLGSVCIVYVSCVLFIVLILWFLFCDNSR